eukprot:1905249-Prymnesium_polylepis.1
MGLTLLAFQRANAAWLEALPPNTKPPRPLPDCLVELLQGHIIPNAQRDGTADELLALRHAEGVEEQLHAADAMLAELHRSMWKPPPAPGLPPVEAVEMGKVMAALKARHIFASEVRSLARSHPTLTQTQTQNPHPNPNPRERWRRALPPRSHRALTAVRPHRCDRCRSPPARRETRSAIARARRFDLSPQPRGARHSPARCRDPSSLQAVQQKSAVTGDPASKTVHKSSLDHATARRAFISASRSTFFLASE